MKDKKSTDIHAQGYVLALAGLIIALSGTAIWWSVTHRTARQSQAPSSYDECRTAPGSSILEIYPEICVTRNGSRFTRPLPPDQTNILRPTAIQVNANEQNRDICENNSGTWIASYNECEGIQKETCEQAGGIFEPCASACRHDPQAEVCIQICVPVCSF